MNVLGLDQRVVVDEALRMAHNRFVMDADCENENDCVYCAELE